MAEIKNIPDLIYLQVDPDGWIADDLGSAVNLRNLEVTWCEDNIDNRDVKYLRATPVREAALVMYEAMLCRQRFEKYATGISPWPGYWGHAEISRYCKLVVAKEKNALALTKKEEPK